MEQYEVLNQCLRILKSSKIDVMDKLRMENLMLQMKMLLLVDVHKQESMPEIFTLHNFEELLDHVKEVCNPEAAADGVKDLFEHVRKMHSAMSVYLNKKG